MMDRSDTEADFHPTNPADLAILNMDIANADACVAEQLAGMLWGRPGAGVLLRLVVYECRHFVAEEEAPCQL